MRYLITGCAGFLGTNLGKRLLEDGNEVFGIDNFITGQKSNIDILNQYELFHFFEFDLCYTKIFPNVDYVFNLACPASPVHYSKYPLETMDVCYEGLINLLDFYLQNDTPLFHSSTSEVYGDPLVSPQKEVHNGNVNSYGPRSCYDCGKQLAESLCYEYAKLGSKIHLGRIFNTYGDYMCKNDGRVVSEFIVKALNNEDLIIYGDGNTTRSFCYVSDLIDSFMKFSKSEHFNTPINLGNPEEFTLNELANLILAKTNTQSKVIYLPFKQDDPKQRKPDITKAKDLLNWNAKVSLSEGLDKTIDYFKSIV